MFIVYTVCSRLLHLLHEADPTENNSDSDEMLNLEGKCFIITLGVYICPIYGYSTNSETGINSYQKNEEIF